MVLYVWLYLHRTLSRYVFPNIVLYIIRERRRVIETWKYLVNLGDIVTVRDLYHFFYYLYFHTFLITLDRDCWSRENQSENFECQS